MPGQNGPVTGPTTPPAVAPERGALVAELRRRAALPGARVLVVGEPGLGKTTVLDAAVRAAREDGGVVLDARPSGAGGHPFSGLIDLLREVPDDRLAALPPVQRTAVEVALARRSVDRPLPPTALRTAVAALVHDLLDRSAVSFAVDDWPQLDPESAAVVRHVLTRPPRDGRAPGLLATQRVDGLLSGARDRVDGGLFRPADVLAVPPLSADSVDELIAGRTGTRWNRGLVEEVHRVTGGNPLWAAELSHPFLGAAAPAPGGLGLPASLTDLLSARMGDLTTEARHAVAAVVALGRATPELLRPLVSDAQTALADAVTANVLRHTGRGVEPVHPLLGAAALETLTDQQRRRLHALAAVNATSSAERAHHLDLAVAAGPDEAVAAAFDAATCDARSSGATAAALAHAARAVDRSRPGSEASARRVVTVAEVAFAAGDLDRVIHDLERLVPGALPLDLLDRTLPLLVEALVVRSGEGRAHQLLARVAEVSAGQPLAGAVLDAYRAEDGSRTMADRRARAESAIAVLTADGRAPSSLHRALTTLVQLRLDDGCGLDHDLLARASALEDSIPLVSVLDSARAVLAVTAFQVDDVGTSVALLEQLVEEAAAAGDEATAGFLGFHLALAVLLAGDVHRAGELLDALGGATPWSSAHPPFVVRARGTAAIARGDAAGLAEVIASPGHSGSPAVQEWTRLALRGIADARAEDWTAALPSLSRARRLADDAGVRDPGRRLWLDVELVEVLCALGRPDEAEQVAARFAEVAGHGRRPLAAGLHHRAAGLVAAARGDLPAARRLLEQSVEVLGVAGYPVQHARSLLELGRLMRRRRERRRADEVIARAAALAAETGEVPLRHRVEQLVGAAGTRASALTPAEERVAAAVAAGASNREIAAAQFVSVRTVESHLSSIYRKLRVDSRTRLLRAIEDGAARSTSLG